jgi:cytochrome P450
VARGACSVGQPRPAVFERPTTSTSPDPNPYLSFGAGIHYCLGAPLAKLELSVAFATLLRRVPRLELVEPPRWKPTFVLRGLEALRVRI